MIQFEYDVVSDLTFFPSPALGGLVARVGRTNVQTVIECSMDAEKMRIEAN